MWEMGKRFRAFLGRRSVELTPRQLGSWGEATAQTFLEKNRYRIVATGFRAPIGHRRDGRQIFGEIDLIAYDESVRPFTLVFIEVKTRRNAELALPEAAVDRAKRRRIIRTARVYRRLLRIENEPWRYDVVTILSHSIGIVQIDLLRNYFSE